MQLRWPNIFLGLQGQTFTNSKILDLSVHELNLYTGGKTKPNKNPTNRKKPKTPNKKNHSKPNKQNPQQNNSEKQREAEEVL